MPNNEFQIGDKVVLIKEDSTPYQFGGTIGRPKIGTIVTISAKKGTSYGVEGSYCGDRANWLRMEEFFVKYKPKNWKEMLIK